MCIPYAMLHHQKCCDHDTSVAKLHALYVHLAEIFTSGKTPLLLNCTKLLGSED